MKSVFYFFAVLFFSMLLTGCPISEVAVIYNNSNEEIVIELNERKVTLLSNERLEIGSKKEQVSWSEMPVMESSKGTYFTALTFSEGGEKYTYKLSFPEGEDGKHFVNVDGRKYFHLQVDKGGVLSLVPYSTSFPVGEESRYVLPEL